MTSDYPLELGLYQALRTLGLDRRLAQMPEIQAEFTDVVESDSSQTLGAYVGRVVAESLARLDNEQRKAAVNRVIASLSDDQEVIDDLAMVASANDDVVEELTALRLPGSPALPRPKTPLVEPALLTNSRGEPNIGEQIGAELGSADQVDILMAFVKYAGINTIKEQLGQLVERGARLRVITTTYCGATDRRAIDLLVSLGAEVKIRYEKDSTRLHAKAWLFRRNTGFDTAYVGSSNLSFSAMTDGLEWNVRLTSVATSALLKKFSATFDTYWADESFETYSPDRDGDRLSMQLNAARLGASGQSGSTGEGVALLSGLEVRPRAYQRRMLEALAAEREVHDRHRNLLVAATGTGKTVVAALDYKALLTTLSSKAGTPPRLLFVAHRKEILEQARRVYREVLNDGSFGELWGYQQVPVVGDHVFASIQTLANSTQPLDFDVVVIDEFHHAEASSYKKLLDRLSYRELLGMTATPERGDGVNVAEIFDGRIAYELRLWDALEEDILSPFHYYGIADNTDLSGVTWKRGAGFSGAGYDVNELEKIYTGDKARLRIILKSLNDNVSDPKSMRALGFCVSVNHAQFMARQFNEAGIAAASVTGETPLDERRAAFNGLRSGKLACLFGVDVFNEGLDVPMVDTVLMLRPTSSSTIFLQQLGRGLRRSPEKAVTTVLDFVGQHREEFNLAARFRAMTGKARKQLEREIDEGFPFLPSGTRIKLDRLTKERALRSARATVALNIRSMTSLVSDINVSVADLTLDKFLDEADLELEDVYRSGWSWTSIRRRASLLTEPESPSERDLGRRMRHLTHVDDRERAAAYARIAAGDVGLDEMTATDRSYAHMLLAVLFRDKTIREHPQCLVWLRESTPIVEEIVQLMDIRQRAISEHIPRPIVLTGGDPVLQTHAYYKAEELLAALGWLGDPDGPGKTPKPSTFREGVAWIDSAQVDLFFVTLKKHARHFNPSTMYHDYAVSPTEFHWQSQSRTSEASPTGQRYINHRDRGSDVVLAVRELNENDFGSGAPFFLAGPMDFVSTKGDRPMSINWKLHRPLPEDVTKRSRIAAI